MGVETAVPTAPARQTEETNTYRGSRFHCRAPTILCGRSEMLAVRKPALTIYVDRSSQQWVVRDAEGNIWVLPSTDNPWGDRRPFVSTDDTELEPVPGHYRYMLGLPP